MAWINSACRAISYYSRKSNMPLDGRRHDYRTLAWCLCHGRAGGGRSSTAGTECQFNIARRYKALCFIRCCGAAQVRTCDISARDTTGSRDVAPRMHSQEGQRPRWTVNAIRNLRSCIQTRCKNCENCARILPGRVHSIYVAPKNDCMISKRLLFLLNCTKCNSILNVTITERRNIRGLKSKFLPLCRAPPPPI